jgi:hypothetical protein
MAFGTPSDMMLPYNNIGCRIFHVAKFTGPERSATKMEVRSLEALTAAVDKEKCKNSFTNCFLTLFDVLFIEDYSREIISAK